MEDLQTRILDKPFYSFGKSLNKNIALIFKLMLLNGKIEDISVS